MFKSLILMFADCALVSNGAECFIDVYWWLQRFRLLFNFPVILFNCLLNKKSVFLTICFKLIPHWILNQHLLLPLTTQLHFSLFLLPSLRLLLRITSFPVRRLTSIALLLALLPSTPRTISVPHAATSTSSSCGHPLASGAISVSGQLAECMRTLTHRLATYLQPGGIANRQGRNWLARSERLRLEGRLERMSRRCWRFWSCRISCELRDLHFVLNNFVRKWVCLLWECVRIRVKMYRKRSWSWKWHLRISSCVALWIWFYLSNSFYIWAVRIWVKFDSLCELLVFESSPSTPPLFVRIHQTCTWNSFSSLLFSKRPSCP